MQSTCRVFFKGVRGKTSLNSWNIPCHRANHPKQNLRNSIGPTPVPELASSLFHTLTLKREKEEKDGKCTPYDSKHHNLHNAPFSMTTNRNYSLTTRKENTTLILALGTVAATAKAGQYAFQAYEEWKASRPEEDINTSKAEDPQSSSTNADTNTSSSSSGKEGSKASNGTKRENMFASFFNVGSKYYEGGFEEKMTRREAALILGVRESSTEKRIKEAHRKLLILNHPDTGGSTYLSGKINEAKELLLKKNKM
jgi:DnaJ homolog subfamily C member 19